MALAKHSSHTQNQAASVRELKHRVLTCLKKLSDRDIHSIAATELESIAKTLTRDSIPPFISSISAIDATDKSPVRKQCVRLISLLSETHGDALSPYLSKNPLCRRSPPPGPRLRQFSDRSSLVHSLGNRRFARSGTSILEEAVAEAREVAEVREL
ncbi:hypothetical protein F0562_023760 [Nyssa sinensis]|uniref:TORTIFOLIA1/SINE1-2 N-terminal domain-containing protein n=1 Tax=Nyssa sinensis TaxID=561372 RepID=A0A5J5BIY0_9ASTE|nr:hypothetical protein F0562_023760 [Nyssa sinensis]